MTPRKAQVNPLGSGSSLSVAPGRSCLPDGGSGAVYAQGSSGYELSWWTVEGGGGTSADGGHRLSSTDGQPDTGVLTGSDYILNGGFWSGGFGPGQWRMFLPLVLRNY